MAVEKNTLRLLDANLNRAREGLRVLEDTARFIWNDSKLYRRLRGIRHTLHVFTGAHYKELLISRNSQKDSGRELKEGSRKSISEIVAANIRRAQEAVRVLEEYSKVFRSDAAAGFKKIRYQLYMEEKKLVKRL